MQSITSHLVPHCPSSITGTAAVPARSPEGSHRGAPRPTSVAGTAAPVLAAAVGAMPVLPSPRQRQPLLSDTEGDSDDAPAGGQLLAAGLERAAGGGVRAGEGEGEGAAAEPATFVTTSPLAVVSAAAVVAAVAGAGSAGSLSGRPPRPRGAPALSVPDSDEVPHAAAAAAAPPAAAPAAVAAAATMAGVAAALATLPPEPSRMDPTHVGLLESGADLEAMLPPPPDLQSPAYASRSMVNNGTASPATASPEPPQPQLQPQGRSVRGLHEAASAALLPPEPSQPAALTSASPQPADAALLHHGLRSSSLGAASAAANAVAAAGTTAAGSLSAVPQDPARWPPSRGSNMPAAAGPSRLKRNASASSAAMVRGGGSLLPVALRQASERMVRPGGAGAVAAPASDVLAAPILPTLGEVPGDAEAAPAMRALAPEVLLGAAAAAGAMWPPPAGMSVSALAAPHGGARTEGSLIAFAASGAGDSNGGDVSGTGTGTTGGGESESQLAGAAAVPALGRVQVGSPRRTGSMGSGVNVSRNRTVRAVSHQNPHSTDTQSVAGARLNRPSAGEGGMPASAAPAQLVGSSGWSGAASAAASQAGGGWASQPASRAASRAASRKALRSGAAGMVAAAAAPVVRSGAMPAALVSAPPIGGMAAARRTGVVGAAAAVPWNAQQQQQLSGAATGGVSWRTNSFAVTAAPAAQHSGSHANLALPPAFSGPALYGTASGRAFPLYQPQAPPHQPPQMHSSQRLAYAVSPAAAATTAAPGLMAAGAISAAGPLSGSSVGLWPYPVPAAAMLAAGGGIAASIGTGGGGGVGAQWHPDATPSVRLSHQLEAVGMDEVRARLVLLHGLTAGL